MSAWPFRPGDPVATTARIRTALADVPAGTFAIVVWADLKIATIQPLGHMQQHNVPLVWLERIETPERDPAAD